MDSTAVTHVVPDVVTHTVINDPTMQGLAWVAGIVALIIAIGKPIRDYIRQERRAAKEDTVGAARSSAEVALYTQLAEQIKEYRAIADAAFRERNELIQRVAALEARAKDFQEAQEEIAKLQANLGAKDRLIQDLIAKSAEERQQFLRLIQDKEREIQEREERISVLEKKIRIMEEELLKWRPVSTSTNQENPNVP